MLAVPQFGLLDELTELKKASEAEEKLDRERGLISVADEPVRLSEKTRRNAFLTKRSQGPTFGEMAASDLTAAISDAESANAIGDEGQKVVLDAGVAAKAKEATAAIEEAAFAFDAASSALYPSEESDVRRKLRAAVQSAK